MSKICNSMVEVSKGIELNDKDYCTESGPRLAFCCKKNDYGISHFNFEYNKPQFCVNV